MKTTVSMNMTIHMKMDKDTHTQMDVHMPTRVHMHTHKIMVMQLWSIKKMEALKIAEMRMQNATQYGEH